MSTGTTPAAGQLDRLFGILDLASAIRQHASAATLGELADGLLATDRVVRAVRVDGRGRSVAVTIGNITVRLSIASGGQGLALRSLYERGEVTLALALPLEDGRIMLGFAGFDEDVLVSARVAAA